MKKSELTLLIKECYNEILTERANPLTNDEIESELGKMFTVYEVGYKINGDIVTLYSDNSRIQLKILNGTK